MAENRSDRELGTREKKARTKSWRRPSVLPVPKKEPGYDYHWVRVSMMGEADPRNVSEKLNEGWEPVKASDHPEMHTMYAENDKFKDNIIIGGLMLCKMPSEIVEERNAFYKQQAGNQMQAVDNNLMRESDPRMPMFNQRRSKVTFGNGT